MKTCSKCKKLLSLEEFYKNKTTKDGLHNQCKICLKEFNKEKYRLNPEYKKQINRKWREENPEKVREINRNNNRQWRLKNKEHYSDNRRKYEQKRRDTDINYKLKKNLRVRLYKALKDNYKTGSAIRDLGCSIEELKIHLEKQFQPGMTWENYGTMWHIDHIIPLYSVDLTDKGQFLKVCNFNNLQPLLIENHILKTRYDLKKVKSS